MRRLMILAGAAMLALSVTAAAQDSGKKAKAPPAPRSAASIECSKQADAKGLHGKARKSFRSRCKRNLARAAKSKG